MPEPMRGMMLVPDSLSQGLSDVELVQASEPRDQGFQPFATGRVAAGLACALLMGVGLVAVHPQQQHARAGGLGLTQLDAVHPEAVKKQGVAAPERKNTDLEFGTANPDLEARLDKYGQKRDTVPRPNSSADLWPGWPCGPEEEIFDSECYMTCEKISGGKLKFRADPCKCCADERCLQTPPPADSKPVMDCGLYDKAADGQGAHQPILPDCPYEDEEIFEGLCYTKCSLLTMGKYPIRTAMNTCSNNDYGGEWTQGFGPCSGFGIGGTKCSPHIPKAYGAGFDQPNLRPGIGPFGWTTVKLPTVPEEFGALASTAR